MLKKILTSLALIFGWANISIASEITKVPTELLCGTDSQFNSVLEKYGEIPFATMISMREIPGVGFRSFAMVIFVNPKTKSYTMLEQMAPDLYCIISIGENIEPYRETQ